MEQQVLSQRLVGKAAESLVCSRDSTTQFHSGLIIPIAAYKGVINP